MEEIKDLELSELQELALRNQTALPRKFGNPRRSMYLCTANPKYD